MNMYKSLRKRLKVCGFYKHVDHSGFFFSVHKIIITWHQNLSWGKARSQFRSSAMNFARSKNSSTKAGSLTTGGGLYSTKDRSAFISGCCRKPKHCIKTTDQVAGMPSSHLHCSLNFRKPTKKKKWHFNTIWHSVPWELPIFWSFKAAHQRVCILIYQQYFQTFTIGCTLLTNSLAKQSSHAFKTNSNTFMSWLWNVACTLSFSSKLVLAQHSTESNGHDDQIQRRNISLPFQRVFPDTQVVPGEV